MSTEDHSGAAPESEGSEEPRDPETRDSALQDVPGRQEQPKAPSDSETSSDPVKTFKEQVLGRTVILGCIAFALIGAFELTKEFPWHSFVIAAILTVSFLALAHNLTSSGGSRGWWFGSGFLSVVAFTAAWAYWSARQELGPDAQSAAWLPPELPPECTRVTVRCAGIQVSQEVSRHQWGVTQFGRNVVSATVTNNRLFVDAVIAVDSEHTFTIRDLMLNGNMPREWDRNHSANAFEIVGTDQLPILQIYYKNPEYVVVDGVFSLGNGRIVGGFGGRQGSGGSPHLVLPLLTNRVALFRYPSWRFPGLLDDSASGR